MRRMPYPHLKTRLSDEHRSNLAKLSAYLRTQAKPEHFHMAAYFCQLEDLEKLTDLEMDAIVDIPVYDAGNPATCGSAACALGHGPAAGITVPPTVRLWWDYAFECFGIRAASFEWNFVFGADWCSFDNTHQGAADRIDYYLEHGVPDCTNDTWCQFRSDGL